ncbi:MAG: KH domain-containing protein [Clostridia bacterium]|nr:KH domain-containing protein [Deltaproteobacteria bacterium]
MPRQEFRGRSAAEAAIKACEALGVSRAALKYEVTSETGEGLSRIVVISADAGEKPVRAPSYRESGTREARAPRDRPPARSEAASSNDDSEDDGQERMLVDRDSGPNESSNGDDRGPRDARPPRSNGTDVSGSDRRRGRRGGRGRGGERDSAGGGRSERGGRGGDRGGRDRNRGPRFGGQDDDGIESLLNMNTVPASDVPERPEVTSVLSARAQRAKTAIEEMVKRMGLGLDARVVQDEQDEIHFDLRGDDTSRIIGKKGEALLSLQFLLNRIVARDEDGEQHVVLDAAGYRHRRRAALADLARRLATRAVAERKVVRLSPMSAHDRRIFHITLQEMDGVSTRSQGDGLYRPLLIIPQDDEAGGDEADE